MQENKGKYPVGFCRIEGDMDTVDQIIQRMNHKTWADIQHWTSNVVIGMGEMVRNVKYRRAGVYKDGTEHDFPPNWAGHNRTGDTFLVIFRTGQHFFHFQKVSTIHIDTKNRTGDNFLDKNRTGDKKIKLDEPLIFWPVLIYYCTTSTQKDLLLIYAV